LAEGKKAVTVHVNKAEGALDSPGADRWVDVVLTRQLANDAAVNDVVVQKARVLAVDRGADFARGERASTDAVTLEVDTEDAQKLLLASRFGTLSLILRASGDHSVHEARQVGVSDLIKAAPTPEPDDDRFTLVRINRPGTGPTVHRVPKER
jgi:Flp pilus assembly protein CpaB